VFCIIETLLRYIVLQVPCKIIHIKSGKSLIDHLSELQKHFLEKGSPIMMGKYNGKSLCLCFQNLFFQVGDYVTFCKE